MSTPRHVTAQEYIGRWAGRATQSGQSFAVTMTLERTAGSINYPSAGCGGTLTLKERRDGRDIFSENLTYGAAKCMTGLLVRVLAKGATLEWEEITRDGGVVATARLARQASPDVTDVQPLAGDRSGQVATRATQDAGKLRTLSTPDIVQVVPYRSLYPGKQPCDEIIDLAPDHVGVITIVLPSSGSSLRARIFSDAAHTRLLDINPSNGTSTRVWVIPAGQVYRRLYMDVASSSGAPATYEIYAHSFNAREQLQKAMLQTFGAQILAWWMTSGDKPASTSTEAAAGAVATAVVSLLSGADASTIATDAAQSLIVGEVNRKLGTGVVGEAITNTVVSFQRSYTEAIRDYRQPPADWQPRIGTLSCIDLCSIMLPHYVSTSSVGHVTGADGTVLWGDYSRGSFEKAAEDGQIFAPPCEALERALCQSALGVADFPSEWPARVAELAARRPDTYRAMIDSYNRACAASPDATRALAASALRKFSDPPAESRFLSDQPTRSQSSGTRAGALIHALTLRRYSPNGDFGAPMEVDFSPQMSSLLRPSLLQVFNRRALVLSCYYQDRNPRLMNSVHYWYDSAPATSDELRAIHEFHPLLRIGAARRSCPGTLDEAHGTQFEYITRDQAQIVKA
ncbi:MAG: hypothetical protein V4550_10235 [Gemmatimonadota bacterium]